MDGADPSCAVSTHAELVRAYGLKADQVLLLKHTPGATPAFVEHDPEEVADIPGGACKSIQDNVEDSWCVSNCAVNNCPEAMCECDEEARLRRQRLMKGVPYWWAAAMPTKKYDREGDAASPMRV